MPRAGPSRHQGLEQGRQHHGISAGAKWPGRRKVWRDKSTIYKHCTDILIILALSYILPSFATFRHHHRTKHRSFSCGSRHVLSSLPALKGALNKHVDLFRRLQCKWQCFDAYARVCMALGANQLLVTKIPGEFDILFQLRDVITPSAVKWFPSKNREGFIEQHCLSQLFGVLPTTRVVFLRQIYPQYGRCKE